uniref:Uncharacterized protein n=1 Tax=Arundo donax TaxID=35708 RepID=A0A0A9DQ76_ARUDO
MGMTFLPSVKNGLGEILLESHTGMRMMRFSGIDCIVKLDEWNRSRRSQERDPGEKGLQLLQLCLISGKLLHPTLMSLMMSRKNSSQVGTGLKSPLERS